MSAFHEFVASVLADRKIDDAEVSLIHQHLFDDGQLNLDDVKLLVELYCTAGKYGPAFEDLFFSVLEQVMLADGVIDTAEQYYLLKMLYSDHEIRPREREFLLRLRSLSDLSPEMESLCDEALSAHPTQWSVGGS